MRHYHLLKNKYHCPIVNVDKLWALVGEEVSACKSMQEGDLPCKDYDNMKHGLTDDEDALGQ